MVNRRSEEVVVTGERSALAYCSRINAMPRAPSATAVLGHPFVQETVGIVAVRPKRRQPLG
jgi:hypothetical protein